MGYNNTKKKCNNKKFNTKKKGIKLLKNILKKKTLKGGEKVGEGSFGCVVKPNIPCRRSNKRYPNTISKIIHTKNNADYLKEFKIYKKIRKIDTSQKYLISFIEECPLYEIDISSRHPRDILTVELDDNNSDKYRLTGDNRQFRNKFNNKDIDNKFCKIDIYKNPRNMIQPFGGDDLRKFMRSKNLPNLSILKKYYKNAIYNLCYGIYLMHRAKMVHRDIKDSNILIVLEKKRIKKSKSKTLSSESKSNNSNDFKILPRLRHIDFGLSEDFSSKTNRDIYDIHQQGTPGYVPIDIVILSKIKTKIHYNKDIFNENIKDNVINSVYNYYKKKMSRKYSDYKINKSFINLSNKQSSGSLNEYLSKENIENLYDKYANLIKEKKLSSVYFKKYDGYVYKTDVFALGLVFRNMINSLNIQDQSMNLLIKKMCQIDPDDRLNIKEIIQDKVFKKL